MLAVIVVQCINYVSLALDHRQSLAKLLPNVKAGPSALRRHEDFAWNGLAISKIDALDQTSLPELAAGDVGVRAHFYIAFCLKNLQQHVAHFARVK